MRDDLELGLPLLPPPPSSALPPLLATDALDACLEIGSAAPGDYVMATQVMTQIKAVLYTLIWSGVGSAILFKVVDLIVGLRVPVDAEREGLDVAEHGERAYNM